VLIIRRSLARQGFEDYISGKLSLFFLLPHRNEKSQKSLAERVHSCEKFSYSCDRDVAAAQVMLNYARGWERAYAGCRVGELLPCAEA